MSLESLVEEIRSRGEAELSSLSTKRDADLAQIASDRDARVAALRAEVARSTELETARERGQRIAAAHLAARRLLYEAREDRLTRGLESTRQLLTDLTERPEYSAVLRRMISSAGVRLGKGVRLTGRSEDAALLSRLAGKAFDPTPRAILGGLVAETPDGRRRLDLSLDELLRQHADAVRALLA